MREYGWIHPHHVGAGGKFLILNRDLFIRPAHFHAHQAKQVNRVGNFNRARLVRAGMT